MTTQPEALRLADEIAAMLPTYVTEPVAAELRRLSAENEALQNTKHYEAPRGFVLNPDYLVPELRAQRDALLAIVRRIADQGCVTDDGCGYCLPCEAEAAIKAVEGETK